MKITELITDPSSGQLSMSRLCLGVVILIFFPVHGLLSALGINVGAWEHLVHAVGIVAGIYGVNSAAGAWRHGGPDNGESGSG